MSSGKNYTGNILFLLFIFFLSYSSVIGQKKIPPFRGAVGTPDNNPLRFITNSVTRMQIDGDGNVDIGMASSSSTAKVSIFAPTSISKPGIGLDITNGYTTLRSMVGTQDAYFGTATSGSLSFLTNNTPRIYISASGKVGIGTIAPGNYMLAVEGAIGARSIEVKATPWADFVFDKNYKLRPLKDVEDFINTHKHLPDVPSEEQVKKDGIDLGKMSATLLQKIEELTLYTIEQNKRIEAIEKENALLKKKLSRR